MCLSEMDSIAYTNLRKEPGMEILPRWVELPRTDRHRVKRMTSQQIMALLIERKLTNGTQPRSIDEALRMRFLERYHARHVPTPANPFRDTIPF